MKYLLDKEESERLVFRKVRISDFDIWLEFYKQPETSAHWISEKQSPSVECKNWYKKQFYRYKNDKGGMNALIEKTSGKLIGHSGLLIQTVDGKIKLEIAYSLLPEFWNKGYAIEAAKKCKDFAFENNLTKSLISIISVTNISSEKVALKNGLKFSKRTFYNRNHVNIFRVDKIEG